MAAGTQGVQLPVPLDLRDEFLWQALKIKVLHPDQFLPVTDVKVRCRFWQITCPFALAITYALTNSGRRARAMTARARTGR